MQLHFRLNQLHQLLQLVEHVLTGQRLEDIAVDRQETVLVFGHAQELAQDRVIDVLFAHTLFLGKAFRAVELGVVKAVIDVVQDPFPLAPFGMEPVETGITDIAVAEEHFEADILEQVVDVHVFEDIVQILLILRGVSGLDLLQHALPFARGAILEAPVALQEIHVVRLIQGNPFKLGQHVTVRALPEVHTPPVNPVQVNRIGFPGPVGHLALFVITGLGGIRIVIQIIFLVVVDQPALEPVLQAGPHGVVPAVPQDKALVFRIGPVREKRRVEGFGAVFALGPELEALLGHIQGEVAHQGEAAVLAYQQRSAIVVELHMDLVLHAGIFHFPVNRVLEGQLARLLDHIVPGHKHTGFLVPQVIRIRDHRDQWQRVICVDEESSRQGVAGFHLPGGKGLCSQHRREVQLQLFAVIRVGILRRGGTVCRVEDLRALRHIELHICRGIILPRLNREGGHGRVSDKAVPVGLERRRRVIIKKTRDSEGSAIGDICSHLRQDHLVQHLARRIRQRDGFSVQLSDLE